MHMDFNPQTAEPVDPPEDYYSGGSGYLLNTAALKGLMLPAGASAGASPSGGQGGQGAAGGVKGEVGGAGGKGAGGGGAGAGGGSGGSGGGGGGGGLTVFQSPARCSPHEMDAREDVLMAQCLGLFPLVDSRDKAGGERWHCLKIDAHLSWSPSVGAAAKPG
jgi:hypothetical protein